MLPVSLNVQSRNGTPTDRVAEHMRQLIAEGKLKVRETEIQGLESCPQGLVGLFEGKNTGKLVVKLDSNDSKL